MMLFQRTMTLQGPADEIGAWTQEVCGLVQERTGAELSAWSVTFGAPTGTIGFSMRIESMTVLEAIGDSFAHDKEYQAMVARAGGWITTPIVDSLLRAVHAAGPEYRRGPVGSYVELTQALPAEGRLRDAMRFAEEIGDLHSQLTGAPVLTMTSAYGDFGEIRWLAAYPDAATVDAAAEAVAKDEVYAERLDDAGDLFQAGSARRGLARRIA